MYAFLGSEMKGLVIYYVKARSVAIAVASSDAIAYNFHAKERSATRDLFNVDKLG